MKVTSTDNQHRQDFLTNVAPNMKVNYIADLPDVKPLSSSGTIRKKTMVKRVEYYGATWQDTELTDAEFKAGGLYLPIRKNEPEAGHTSYGYVMQALDTGPIIAVPATFHKRFENAKQWVTVMDHGRAKVDALGVANVLRVARRENRGYYCIRGSNSLPDLDRPEIALYNKYIASAKEVDPVTGLAPSAAWSIAISLGLTDYNTQASVAQRQTKVAAKLYQRAIAKYPLLDLSSKSGVDDEAWLQYVDAIDNLNQGEDE